MKREILDKEYHNTEEKNLLLSLSETNLSEITQCDVEDIKVLKHIGLKITQEHVSLEEKKAEEILESIKSQKPSKKLSEIVFKGNIPSDPFSNPELNEDKKFIKILRTASINNSLDKIVKKKKSPEKLKAYKNYFIAVFESILIMKKIEPLSEEDLSIRLLSIPRPIDISCNSYLILLANKTLVLDLDETLIHCLEEGKGDKQISIKLPDKSYITVIFKLI